VLLGFGGAGVVEMIEDWEGNTYRAVYTVKFGEFVYVLHCFQKKSSAEGRHRKPIWRWSGRGPGWRKRTTGQERK